MDEIVNEVSEAHVAPVEFEHDYDEVSSLLELRNSKICSVDEFCGMKLY